MNSSNTGKHVYDLVIIGGGGAGLASAVSAAELGIKNVLVLEKRKVLGGNTALAVGLFAAESPVQKRALLNASRDEFFHTAMDFAYWKINPRIVRAFIDKSGDTIRWLEQKGLVFELMRFYPDQPTPTWHAPKGRGAEIIKMLVAECKRLGVKIITGASAGKLLTGRNGRITGVRVQKEGKEMDIKARSIIIATGGYGANKELLTSYCPSYRSYMKCLGIHHTGDGLLMAMDIGAATEGLGLLLMSGPQISGSVQLKIGSGSRVMPVPLMALALEPDTIWVNKNGERFADEAIGGHHYISANAINRQPCNISYTILDQNIVQEMTRHGIVLGMGYYYYEEQRTALPGLERELKLQAAKGMLKISGSWDELARWMGASPAKLKAIINEYNAACDRGHDPLFAKDRKYLVPLRVPPYYAIKADSDFLDTVGGIKINHNMEVLDREETPIPGLYAAGVVAGGWQGDNYCALLSGSACGFAINSGRIAAESALNFIRAK